MVETLVLTASDVTRCLPPADCRLAIERAFALLALVRLTRRRALL